MLKNILCFGDSNTYGYIAGSGARYDENVRWTKRLQKLLGDSYYVIEEGLNGRTTVFDDPEQRFKNGSEYLEMCIITHRPLDLVIIMLGTNDTKERYKAQPADIASGMETLVKILQNPELYNKDILIVSPILVSDSIVKSPYYEIFGLEAIEKSKQLGPEYEKLAKKYNCFYLDAANYAIADDKDAIHLDEKAHASLAEAIYQKIKEIEKIRES